MAESDKNVKFMVYDYLKSVDEKVAAKFKKSQKLDLEKRPGDKRSLLSVIQRVKELDRYVSDVSSKLTIFANKYKTYICSNDSGHESGEKKRKKVGTPLAKSTPAPSKLNEGFSLIFRTEVYFIFRRYIGLRRRL